MAPLALVVGGLAMLFQGVKTLFINWRLTLIQILPAMWIWVVMVDIKAHVLHGKGFHIFRNPFVAAAVIEKARGRLLAGRLIAPEHLHGLVRINAGQSVRVGESPVIDEAVVAGGALKINPEEDLGDILGRLHLGDLACIDHTTPDDPLGKSFGFIGRIDQLGHELVVGHVVGQRGEEPITDLFPSTVNVASPAVVIAKGVVPKRQPMLGIPDIVREKAFDQELPFVTPVVGDEFRQLLRARQEPDHIQVNTAGKRPIANRFGHFETVRLEIWLEQSVDRILQTGPPDWWREERTVWI